MAPSSQSQTLAVRFYEPGGPDVLKLEQTPLTPPGPGEVQLRHAAIGLNFIDTYHRSGLYAVNRLPSGIGMEAVGEITALGEGVTDFAVGQRVGYATAPPGAACQIRTIEAQYLVPIPDDIDDKAAAASLLKGLTAQYLLSQTYKVKAGDYILLYAAAGGVGVFMCQWAKAMGVHVIGVTSSHEKRPKILRNGAEAVVMQNDPNFVREVKNLTDGKGVHVVYDGIGQATFFQSLDTLRPMGMMVSFGNASGPVPAFDPAELSSRGSLTFTRPSLMHYMADRKNLLKAANDVFDALRSGAVTVHIGQSWPLEEIVDAHQALEGRKTIGASILIP